jgi:hypothetical protein
MARRFAEIGLTQDVFESPRFTRLRWLRKLIDEHALDDDLRWIGNQRVARAAQVAKETAGP